MKGIFITFRSVTYAQRGERVLKKRGISAQLQRTPRWMEQQGCGYGLRIRQGDLEMALAALKAEGVAYRRIYRQGESGQLEDWEP